MEALAYAPKKELVTIKGISEAKADKVIVSLEMHVVCVLFSEMLKGKAIIAWKAFDHISFHVLLQQLTLHIIIIMSYLYIPLELPTEIVSISDQGVASLNKVANQTTAINMK